MAKYLIEPKGQKMDDTCIDCLKTDIEEVLSGAGFGKERYILDVGRNNATLDVRGDQDDIYAKLADSFVCWTIKKVK